MKKYHKGVEVGAGDSYSSQLLKRKDEFEFLWLIEPNNILFEDLSKSLGHFKIKQDRVYLMNAAASNSSENKELFNFGYCSYVEGNESFIKMSCEPEAETFWKPLKTKTHCFKFGDIDEGDIDYLVLTCNGGEMDVLNQMKSRPEIITTKFYCHNGHHWAYYNQIARWMRQNNYGGNVLEKSMYDTYFHLEFTRI